MIQNVGSAHYEYEKSIVNCSNDFSVYILYYIMIKRTNNCDDNTRQPVSLRDGEFELINHLFVLKTIVEIAYTLPFKCK